MDGDGFGDLVLHQDQYDEQRRRDPPAGLPHPELLPVVLLGRGHPLPHPSQHRVARRVELVVAVEEAGLRAEAWAVTGDGLELELEREGTRSQNLDLGLVVSEYVQPLGRWTGTIDGQAFEGVGVAEFHRSVW